MSEHTSQDHFSLTVFVRKRVTSILVGFTLSFFLAMVVIVLIPSVYMSSATILVEGRVAPLDMLKTAIAGNVQEHITSVTETILNRENLQRINKQFNPYPQMEGQASEDEIIAQLHRDITIGSPKTAQEEQSLGLGMGRIPSGTYTLVISYESQGPKTAAQVAMVLTNMFVEESNKRRETHAKEAYYFLNSQFRSMEEEIAKVEQKIADFKKKNLRSLPALMDMNLLAMDRTQKEIDTTRMEIGLAKERKAYLEGQLALQKPLREMVTSQGDKILTVEEQLRKLRNEYIALRAVHSEIHPDVARLSRQIAALEGVVKDKGAVPSPLNRLRERQAALSDLHRKYSPQHPQVIALEREVAALAAEVEKTAPGAAPVAVPAGETPDNPVYVTLMTQLTQVNLEIETKEAMLADQEYKYEDYRHRIENTPGVEQDFIALQDQYSSLKNKRADLFARVQNAKEATQIEQQDVGVKLTILESPQIPEKPFKPKRWLLSLLAFFFSLGMGFLAAFTVESMDPTVHNPQEVASLTGLPLLGVLPALETTQEHVRLLRRRRVMVLAGLGTLGVGLLAWLLWPPLSTFFSGLFHKS